MTTKIKSLLIMLAASAGITHAAVAPGEWRLHAYFAAPPEQVVATKAGKVYYLSGGSLFCYDSVNFETTTFSVENYLTDTDISAIYRNPYGDCLVVAYASGNIDLIFDGDSSGEGFRIVNLSDIRDADIESARGINGVDFAPGLLYVATDFGLVEFSLTSFSVVRSGIYSRPVKGVARIGDVIVVYVDNAFYSIAADGRINSFSNFTHRFNWNGLAEMRRIGDNGWIMARCPGRGADSMMAIRFSPSDGSHSGAYAHPAFDGSSEFFPFADGSFGFGSGDYLWHVADYNKVERLCAAPSSGVEVFAVGKGSGEVWSLTADGLESSDRSKAEPVVTTSRFVPEAMAVGNVAFITPAAGSQLYFSNLGCTAYSRFGKGEGYDVMQQTSVLDLADGTFRDVAPRGYVSANSIVADAQKRNRFDRPVSPERIAPHPSEESTYMLATSNDGIFRIVDGRIAGVYDETNSPMKRVSVGCRVFEVAFDHDGNMWAIHASGTDNGAIVMLPAEKTLLDPVKLKPSDWKVVNAPGFSGDKDARILFCSHSGMVVAFDCRSAHGLVAIDSRGTLGDFSDDRVAVATSFVDQDGKKFNLGTERFTSMAEDHRGRLWLGSTYGVIEISDPKSITSSEVRINRLKVPRNDGTNSADYLLASDRIYSISVDPANRKWLATEASGLYLVGERGSEIITHFTAENSPLRSGLVNAVHADPTGNSVYIATADGVYEYGGNASAPADSYDELFVYPNPLRPEHSGPVSITGMMDGSLVKISDAAGNIVAQLHSEGGMAVWDGCGADGRRVKSGVYFVLASGGGGDSGSGSKGGAAKIVVVN